MAPVLSAHFAKRQPSAIRIAGIEFNKRTDEVTAINTHIGNVSLPAHPAIQKRMDSLRSENSPFKDGVIKYTGTQGLPETNTAFLNSIKASGFDASGLYSQITNGGSQAMGLIVIGTCGPAGTDEKPLLLIDPAYTNYNAMASAYGRKTITVSRQLSDEGTFEMPNLQLVREVIEKHKPGAMVVIPYDNPTGQFIDMDTMIELAKLAVEYDLWMISDEAYRELQYGSNETVSIWAMNETRVPGITGRRISIETASKVWNACGLRIGAIVSDNQEFIVKSVAENTKELCPPAIDQWLFAGIAEESVEDLQKWFAEIREYYSKMITKLTAELKEELPGIIVSSPDASIYSVVDVRNLVEPGFDIGKFAIFCASEGKVDVDGKAYTMLASPMEEFYELRGEGNPGLTQMRIAYVESPEKMDLVPKVFAELFGQYISKNS